MIRTLVKNRFSALFGSAVGKARKGKEIKKASTLKIVLFSILFLYLAVVLLGMAIGASYLLSKFLLPSLPWLYFLVFIVLSITLTFILGIFETKTELFECKDNDLLLSMPIKPRDIVAARIIVVLIYNYIINAVLFIPGVVFFAIFGKNFLGVIGGLVLFILLPIFATALASFVGYFVAEISRKIKFKNLVTVIITFVFFGIYSFIIVLFDNNIMSFLESLAGMGDTLAEKYKILLFIGEAALLKPLSMLSVAAISIGAGAMAYLIISSSYIRIVTDRTGTAKAVYKEKTLKKSSVTLSLAKKDIRHFFASPIYIMNGALGLVMCVAIGVFAIIKRETIAMLCDMLSLSTVAASSLAAGLISLACATSIISACSLSIEGKNLWIIKSMPVSAKDTLISKALMQFIISAPPIFVSSVLSLIAIMPTPLLWPVFIIAPQILNAMFSILGILVNVMFPKFTYENEAQAVKQSLSTIVSMMTCMVLSILLLVGIFFLSMYREWLGVLLLIGAPLILSVIEVILLVGPASKRYQKLNV